MNTDPLTQFLYLLMRDQLSTGRVESTMEQVRACKGKEVRHSAPHLEAYAAELAQELRDLTPTIISIPCKDHQGLGVTTTAGFANVVARCPYCARTPA